MIIMHNQHGFVEDGIKLFVVMLQEGIKPGWVIFATSINAFF